MKKAPTEPSTEDGTVGVKSCCSFLLMLCAEALKGAISPDNVMIVISMVVSFYFGTQHEKTANPAVPASQPPAELLGAVSDAAAPVAGSTVDAATYNETHPDSVA